MTFKTEILDIKILITMLFSLVFLQSCGGSTEDEFKKGLVASVPVSSSVISSIGSNRGTGYGTANKVIELNGSDSYLITYLESDGSVVDVILEEYDRFENLLNRSVIGQADNNHGGAAMTLDHDGYLHIVYGPHGTPMRYRRSKEPYIFSTFTEEESFGIYLTYPSILINKQNDLIIAAREGTGGQRAKGSIELYKKSHDSDFVKISNPVVNREIGYAAFSPNIYIDGLENIHMLAVVHEGTDKTFYGRYQAIIYIVSRDGGYSWENSKGKKLKQRADVVDIGPVFEGGMDAGNSVRMGSVSVSKGGNTYISFMKENASDVGSKFYIGELNGSQWEITDLSENITALEDGQRIFDAGILIAGDEELFFVIGIQDILPSDIDPYGGSAWGHSSNSIFQGTYNLITGEVQSTAVVQSSPYGPFWLPNIARATRFGQNNAVPSRIIYTQGSGGEGYLGGDTMIHFGVLK